MDIATLYIATLDISTLVILYLTSLDISTLDTRVDISLNKFYHLTPLVDGSFIPCVSVSRIPLDPVNQIPGTHDQFSRAAVLLASSQGPLYYCGVLCILCSV